ncbi:MAG: hypothetical protein L0H29_06735, partial [Sinobacteraceae bacterium]|nr:hypothetical protein [Nevskiaceae bacterium]
MGDSDQADEQGDLVSEMQETQTELVSESESAPGDVAPVVTADADRDAISQPIDTLYATSTTAVDETDEDAETATEALPPPIPAASPRVAPTYNW